MILEFDYHSRDAYHVRRKCFKDAGVLVETMDVVVSLLNTLLERSISPIRSREEAEKDDLSRKTAGILVG